MSALKFLIAKEFKQFIRNAFLPRMVFLFPLMIMFVMPWIVTLDITDVGVDVIDRDNSTVSERLIKKIEASSYFQLRNVDYSFDEAMSRIEYGSTDIIVEIPHNFEHDMRNGLSPQVMISANSVDGTKGSLGSGYMSAIIADFVVEQTAAEGTSTPEMSMLSINNLYNPTLDYRSFMIPSLMVVLVLMLTGFFPALNIVSEKEIGTIEQINVTPVGKFEFILAKLIPYWIMGLFVLTVCFIIAWSVYGLVPQGHFSTLYGMTMMFILAMSGFGLIVSNYSATIQQAMFVMFFFMMIFMLMSGLFTPVESMPDWAQCISAALPTRYLVDAMRDVYLKGSSFLDLLPQFLILCAFAIALNTWAIISYRKRS